MFGVLAKVGVVGMILLGIALTVLVVTKEEGVASDGGPVETTKDPEELEKLAKKQQMEDLEKFLDGEQGEKQLKGEVKSSTDGGPAADLAKKVEQDALKDAVDLQKFLEEKPETFEKDVEKLANGETDLDQEVMWQIIGDWVYFRISFSPYDQRTHELMQGSDEAVYMSFVDARGQRLVPASAAARIPMRNLYLRREEGHLKGWAYNGKLFLADADPSKVEKSQVGWIFSTELAGHLKDLKRQRAAMAAE